MKQYSSLDEALIRSGTLTEIDDQIIKFTSGHRNIHNTCVFNLYPHLSEDVKDDSRVFQARGCSNEMVELLRPAVVVVAQCDTRDVKAHDIASVLTSSTKLAGTWRFLRAWGRQLLVVYAFHPSNFIRKNYLRPWASSYFGKRTNSIDDADMRRAKKLLGAMFSLAFMLAYNALAGRDVYAPGAGKLRREFREVMDVELPRELWAIAEPLDDNAFRHGECIVCNFRASE